MPRYFFEVSSGGRFTADSFGMDLANDDEARDQALGLLPEMVQHALPNGDQNEFIVRARNEAGEIVYEANLSLDGRWRPGQTR